MFRKYFLKLKPLLFISLLSVSLFYLLPEEQKERFSTAGEDETSQQRLLYWEHGWEMIQENPTLGVGYFNFAPYYQSHFPDDLLFQTAQLPHNIFIQVGTDAGFWGLAFFWLLILYCWWVPIKMQKHPGASEVDKKIISGFGFGVFGFVVAGQFVTVTYYPFFWISLSFITALSSIMKREAATVIPKDKRVVLARG